MARLTAGTFMNGTARIDRDQVIADLARWSQRVIDPSRSLNIDQGIDGDEALSILTRLCRAWAVDEDLFWSKLDYDRYFLSEFSLIRFVSGWLHYLVGFRSQVRQPEPFMVDDLIRLLAACRKGVRSSAS